MSALPDTDRPVAGSSEFFCCNPRCPFHLRVGDPGVAGFGDWATLADGITVSHRWLDGLLLCDLCATAAQALGHAGPCRPRSPGR
jgi:hypothetical protein